MKIDTTYRLANTKVILTFDKYSSADWYINF